MGMFPTPYNQQGPIFYPQPHYAAAPAPLGMPLGDSDSHSNRHASPSEVARHSPSPHGQGSPHATPARDNQLEPVLRGLTDLTVKVATIQAAIASLTSTVVPKAHFDAEIKRLHEILSSQMLSSAQLTEALSTTATQMSARTEDALETTANRIILSLSPEQPLNTGPEALAPAPQALWSPSPTRTRIITTSLWIGGFRSNGKDGEQIRSFLAKVLKTSIPKLRRFTPGSCLIEVNPDEAPRLLLHHGSAHHAFPNGIKIELLKHRQAHQRPRPPQQQGALDRPPSPRETTSKSPAQVKRPQAPAHPENSLAHKSAVRTSILSRLGTSPAKEPEPQPHAPSSPSGSDTGDNLLSQFDSTRDTAPISGTALAPQPEQSAPDVHKPDSDSQVSTTSLASRKKARAQPAKLKASVTPARSSARLHPGKPAAPPVSGQYGSDCPQEDAPSPASTSSLPDQARPMTDEQDQRLDMHAQHSPETVRRYWTRNQASGFYTFRTKYWSQFHKDAHLRADVEPFSGEAHEIDGDGNCFHRAIAFPSQDWASVKRKTFNYLINKFPKVSKNADGTFKAEFFTRFPALTALQNEGTYQAVRTNLRTPGKPANEIIFQLTALAHNIRIVMESLTRPGTFPAEFCPATMPCDSTKHLLMRPDKECPSYEFRNGHLHRLPNSDGHIWCWSRPQPSPGNGRRPVVPRP